ncbi:MAG: YeeE/YedE family protein [Pseudomonadales bacterium]|nr:YeeE/YedE family protein [Pseudomonadales bacterium]
MENFTPVSAVLGGLLIGVAASLTLWTTGRIAGISGIVAGALFPKRADVAWRLLFLGGMLTGGLVYLLFNQGSMDIQIQSSPLTTIVAGLLVGFGTRLGSGCTSGHGICGIARFSKRSFLATSVFILSGVLTVFVTSHV